MKVLVTGGTGFLGRHVVALLREHGHKTYAVGRGSTEDTVGWDLTSERSARLLMDDIRPEVVIHLAARVGGIGFNRDNPATLIHDNLAMATNVVHQAWAHGVKKVVAAGTVCAYPKVPPHIPFVEDDLWAGYPEETNAPYGIAKRALLSLLQAYRAQHGLGMVYLLPTNLYGPTDNFAPHSSHVIPALIRKLYAAKKSGNPPVLWGTGYATRQFLHVRDAARAFVAAAECCETAKPINLSSGSEVSILYLASTIARLVGYGGEILWDTAMPDGQPARWLDGSRARRELGWEAQIGLEEGLAETVTWFLAEAAAGRIPGGPILEGGR